MQSHQQNQTDQACNLVLASTSPFRRTLLEKLQLQFDTFAPKVDESRLKDESAEALVVRLAELKARSGLEQHPDALIIGSDQVASLGGEILGKPGNRQNAIRQLSMASGKKVSFYTGLALLDARSGDCQSCCEPFHVHFRELDQDMIESYLDREEPYNCAGSFKSEALGIAMFEKLEGDDPNTLIGLPLIRLVAMLEAAGQPVLRPLQK